MLTAALALLTGCMTGDDGKPTQYKLSFSANGGTGEMESITKDENDKINLPAVEFSKSGFKFVNWNTVPDGSGISYTDGAEFIFTADTTLYAQWKENKTTPSNPETPENPTQPEQPQNPETPSTPKTTYTVTFDANGGSGSIASISAEEGSEITLPENVFTKDGCIFAGWATESDGNVSYSDKAKITVTGGITLYAKWSLETYTITYELNGGTNATDNPADYNVETDTITLKEAAKNGYAFSGWYKEASFETKITEITKGSTGNITLYAKWNLENYTITYELNGGTNAESNPESYNVETEAVTLLAPSREYFDFGGWYRENSFATKATEIAKGSTGDVTLYAKWTVAAENAVNAINSLPAGEHKIAVTGQMTKDILNGVMEAIKRNPNGAKVYLDLGGTTIDFYDWQRCKFADCENLIGIVIPAIESPDKDNPIILIPDLMFEGCKNLKFAIILNSSDKYKIATFRNCTSLEYVEIPASIVCIYSDAFDGCTALETITYKGTVEQWKQVKTDSKDSKYKLMNLKVQCENGTASGSDLTEG